MRPDELPAEIVSRFRIKALERVDRLETGWLRLTSDRSAGTDVAEEVARELHTLKGDSRAVGFTDVNVLCHKLEELQEVARRLDFRVTEDFDLVMNMGFRFLAMLMRKKIGAALGGIDLPGFIEQIDTVLRDAASSPATPMTRGAGQAAREAPAAEEARHQRLAAVATAIFLEYLAATPPRRERIHRAWTALSKELAGASMVPIAADITKHVAGAQQLARDLGKEVEFQVSGLDAVRVPGQVRDALDAAFVHLLRNAVDHGAEAPARRGAAGKRATSRIAICARVAPDELEIEVSDDGAGIDWEAVRRRAQDLKLLPAGAEVAPEKLAGILFEPGFSTSLTVNDVSGRGVGLDAVRSDLAKARGTITVSSRQGQGSTFLIRLPVGSPTLTVQVVAEVGPVRLAVGASWKIEPARAEELERAVDLFDVLEIDPGPGPRRGIRLVGPERVVVLKTSGDASGPSAVAGRLCPTADLFPMEVVLIDGKEGLLLRPDRLERAVADAALV